MLDVVIRGGEVVDGTGAPRRRADVGISDGRVVQMGDDLGEARRVVDASGRVVTPGFVDVHTHLDAQLLWDPMGSPSPLHGVTSVIAGNCGFTIAPLASSESDYLMRMLARVEGMPLEALQSGVPWDWTTTEEYFDRFDGNLGINAGFMVGHSTMRRVVMGEAANERTCTPEELEQMATLLRAGLRAGGMGFSTTWSVTHNDADGSPVPSRWADHHELASLAHICREFDGTALEFLPGNPTSVALNEENFNVMCDMSRGAGRPINWNLIRVAKANMPRVEERLEVGRRSLEEGARIVMLVIPQPTMTQYTFRTGFALDVFPGWQEPMALPVAEKLAMLRDPAGRRRLAEGAAAAVDTTPTSDFSRYVVCETFTPETKRYQGRKLADIGAEEGKTPFDVLCDINIADGLRTYFQLEIPEATQYDWEQRARVCSDPRALIGGSDAGAHLDMMGVQDYTTNMIANFVRRHHVMSLEDTVRLITDVPARYYGLRDRGRLVEGSHADVVIFDEDAIDATPHVTRTDMPGGASRLYTEGVGIDHVFVNGEEIVGHGEFTDARPGTMLRSGRDTTSQPLV